MPSDQKQKFTTYCNIPDAEGKPCGAAIVVTNGILAPEVGASPQDKTKQFVQTIVGHLMKKHPGHALHAMNTMEQFLAFTSVGFTHTDDPGALSFMAHFAEYLCKISTLPVSDDMIVELVTRMGLTMEDPSARNSSKPSPTSAISNSANSPRSLPPVPPNLPLLPRKLLEIASVLDFLLA